MLKRIFYIVAAILIVIWAIGFFVYALGAVIHLLLIVAIVLIAIRVSRTGMKTRTNTGIKQYPRDPITKKYDN